MYGHCLVLEERGKELAEGAKDAATWVWLLARFSGKATSIGQAWMFHSTSPPSPWG